MTAKVPVQGPDVNVLDRGPPAVVPLSATALGLAQMDPVGRSIAGSGKALPIHEGFQKPDGLLIFVLPVLSDPAADQAQDMAG